MAWEELCALWSFYSYSLVLLSSCNASGKQARTQRGPQTSVRGENQNFLDMTVYVLRGSQRIRLGQVPALSTRVLAIPDLVILNVTALQFLADPVEQRQTPVSEEIPIPPGEDMSL